MESYYFNKEIFVDAVAFLGGNTKAAYPRHMWVDDEEITVTAARRVADTALEVTDGQHSYRVQHDPVRFAWKLLRRRSLERTS